jgi:hypothetical protein
MDEEGMMMRKMLTLLLFAWGLTGVAAQTATVAELSGKVEIKLSGEDWKAAEAGQILGKTAIISTGFKSSALIRVGNSEITVQALTRLSLEELAEAAGNETVNLQLHTGRVRADVAPPTGGKTDFTVRSPSATASVRGTSFEFDGRRLSVGQGRVRLTGGDGTGTYVSRGHHTETNTATGKTTPVADAAQQDLVIPAPAGLGSVSPPPAAPPLQAPIAAPTTGGITVGAGF